MQSIVPVLVVVASTDPCINGSNGPHRNQSRLLICTRPIMTRPVRFELEWNPPPQSWYAPLATCHPNIPTYPRRLDRETSYQTQDAPSRFNSYGNSLSFVLISDQRPKYSRILPLGRTSSPSDVLHGDENPGMSISAGRKALPYSSVAVSLSPSSGTLGPSNLITINVTRTTKTSHQPTSERCPSKTF